MNHNDDGSVTPEPHGGNTNAREVDATMLLLQMTLEGLDAEDRGICFSLMTAFASVGRLPSDPLRLASMCGTDPDTVWDALHDGLGDLFEVDGDRIVPLCGDMVWRKRGERRG